MECSKSTDGIKMKNVSLFIIFFCVFSFQSISEEMDDFVWPPNAIMTEPIYEEDHAPDNIYYKYIRNNSSEGFLYSLFSCTDSLGYDITNVFIIPLKGNDAIFLVYDEDLNYIKQYSIIYDPHILPYSKKKMLYSAKYRVNHAALEQLYEYFHKQLDLEYKLIYKEDLEELLDNIFPQDARVYVDKFNRPDPKYIRKQNSE